MCCFFFNDTATTEIYTLSLHDALPISRQRPGRARGDRRDGRRSDRTRGRRDRLRAAVPPPGPRLLPRPPAVSVARSARHLGDRKSTRLNSSHANISYAVFCLKKKKISP